MITERYKQLKAYLVEGKNRPILLTQYHGC